MFDLPSPFVLIEKISPREGHCKQRYINKQGIYFFILAWCLMT